MSLTPLLSPFGDSDGDGLSMTFADLFLNLAICLLLPGLISTTAIDAQGVPMVRSDAEMSEPDAPPVLLRFKMQTDGTLAVGATGSAVMETLSTLAATDTVIVVLPQSISYGVALAAVRHVDDLTDAIVKQVEYDQ